MPIMSCSCENAQQDALHGVKRRVFNKTAKDPVQYRCTVCSALKGKSGSDPDSKGKGKKK